MARRIQRETQLPALWEILRASPFTLEYDDSEDEKSMLEDNPAASVGRIRRSDKQQRGYFSNEPERHGSHAFDWSFPICRIGVLRKYMKGSILVPPPQLADAFLDPSDRNWTGSGIGPNERRIIEWASENTEYGDYDSATGFGWITMPIETTRSVYVEACPRSDGEIGLWLSVNEPFIDNFIPVLPGCDLVTLAYQREETWHGVEPFALEEDWTGNDRFRTLGILTWPQWCKELVHDNSLWRGGVIGVKDTDSLIEVDHTGEERPGHFRARAPDWFGVESGYRIDPEDDGYIPDGVGGWLDDTSNQELKEALFANPKKGYFSPLIEQETVGDVPCRQGTIAEALLRNIGCSIDERIDQVLINQGRIIVEAAMQHHQARIDQCRAKILKLND